MGDPESWARKGDAGVYNPADPPSGAPPPDMNEPKERQGLYGALQSTVDNSQATPGDIRLQALRHHEHRRMRSLSLGHNPTPQGADTQPPPQTQTRKRKLEAATNNGVTAELWYLRNVAQDERPGAPGIIALPKGRTILIIGSPIG